MSFFYSSRYFNSSFKFVCFLVIFNLVFFGAFGGVFLKIQESKSTLWEIIPNWVNMAVNALSLVANLTGADWLAQVLNYVKALTNLYQTFSNNANTQDQMDKIMREVLRLALNEFHRLLIAFINSKGDPKVIKDYNKEFLNLADRAGGAFMNELAGADLCNKDWGIRLKLLLPVPSAAPDIGSRFKCSLSDIARQAKKTGGVSVSVETVGFDEFAAMFEPQNNFLGTFLMASAGQGAAMNNAVEVGKVEMASGGGTKPVKDKNGNIITPSGVVEDLAKQGVSKDYDLWARQLSAITPFRGKTSALTVVNYILTVANSMASMALQAGLVNVKEDDLPSGNKWEPERYVNTVINNTATNAASKDAGDTDKLANTLKQMKEKMAETKTKLEQIVPVIQAVVDKEKTLPSLIVSKMNKSQGQVCSFASFNQYLTISNSIVSSPSPQTSISGGITTTITTRVLNISISDAVTGESYISAAEITKTTTETNDGVQITTNAAYSLNSQSIVAGHQASLNQYQSSLNNYQIIQDKIDVARTELAGLKTKASGFAALSCVVQKSEAKFPDDLPNQPCKDAYTAYAQQKEKTLKLVQQIYFLMSGGKYSYATAGDGIDLDVSGNGAIENNEKNLTANLDDLNTDFSYLYDGINTFNSKFNTEQIDASTTGVPSSQYCGSSKGFYKTKYCLNDAYSGASGVSCSQ